MKALLLIDLQNDLLPGGAIAVPQGEAVLALANQLQQAFKLVVATQEWHPPNHKSFAANHLDRKPGEVVILKKQRQMLWPTHCIQNTRGAALAPALNLSRVNKVFRKGTDPEIDTLSGFSEQDCRQTTTLSGFLKAKRVTQVFLMGLATEEAVKFTALDAVALDFETFVIEDACRARDTDAGADALSEMEESGVKIIHSRDLLATPPLRR